MAGPDDSYIGCPCEPAPQAPLQLGSSSALCSLFHVVCARLMQQQRDGTWLACSTWQRRLQSNPARFMGCELNAGAAECLLAKLIRFPEIAKQWHLDDAAAHVRTQPLPQKTLSI